MMSVTGIASPVCLESTPPGSTDDGVLLWQLMQLIVFRARGVAGFVWQIRHGATTLSWTSPARIGKLGPWSNGPMSPVAWQLVHWQGLAKSIAQGLSVREATWQPKQDCL